jgi:hypothetical protein
MPHLTLFGRCHDQSITRASRKELPYDDGDRKEQGEVCPALPKRNADKQIVRQDEKKGIYQPPQVTEERSDILGPQGG